MDRRLPSINCFTNRKDESWKSTMFSSGQNALCDPPPEQVMEKSKKLPCMSTFLSSVRNKINENENRDQGTTAHGTGQLSKYNYNAMLIEEAICQKIYLYTKNENNVPQHISLNREEKKIDNHLIEFGDIVSPPTQFCDINQGIGQVKSYPSSFDSMTIPDTNTLTSYQSYDLTATNGKFNLNYPNCSTPDAKLVFSHQQPENDGSNDAIMMVQNVSEPSQCWLSNMEPRRDEDYFHLHGLSNTAHLDIAVDIENSKMDQDFTKTYTNSQETIDNINFPEGILYVIENNIINTNDNIINNMNNNTNTNNNTYPQQTLSHSASQPMEELDYPYYPPCASEQIIPIQQYVDNERENVGTAQMIGRGNTPQSQYQINSQYNSFDNNKQYDQQDNSVYQTIPSSQLTQAKAKGVENELQHIISVDDTNSLPALSSLFGRKDASPEGDSGCDELTDAMVRDLLSNKGKKKDSTYIALISMAIFSSPDKKMLLSDIYDYLSKTFKLDTLNSQAWRNSVRHNLSLNECFVKHKRYGRGRGHYWSIHPACVEDFSKGDFRRRKARRLAQRNTMKGTDRITGARNANQNQCASEIFDGTDGQSF